MGAKLALSPRSKTCFSETPKRADGCPCSATLQVTINFASAPLGRLSIENSGEPIFFRNPGVFVNLIQVHD